MLHSLSKFLKILVIAITTLVLVLFAPGVFLRIVGYYPDGLGWKVAEIIAKTSKNPRDCYKIIHPIPHLFSPSAGEQRSLCIFTYASLTKDPSACELLLPSEYGLACISNLWLQAMPGDGCGWNYTNPQIYECRHGYGPLQQSSNCKDFSDNPKYFSACISDTAERNRDLELCKEIPDQFIRSFCETRVGTWLKYPQLRNSSYFGRNTNEK